MSGEQTTRPGSRRAPLRFLQYAWPCVAFVVVANSIATTWAGSVEQVHSWIEQLPLLSGIVTIMAAAAGGGPLLADQIKAKAGILKE